MKKVTSRMVARAAGVSQSTVSKVINNHPGVALDTVRQVIRVANELNYPLIPQKKGATVAVILPETTINGYIAAMFSAISRELLSRGMRLEIVFDCQLELLNERCISGAISISWLPELPTRWGELFLTPLIRINGASDHANNCWSICYDGFTSMKYLMDRFHRLGHRKIGYLSWNSRSHEEQTLSRRFPGFRMALETMTFEDPEQYSLFDGSERNPEELARTIKQWMDEGVTALVAADELFNFKLNKVIEILNLKIPQDLSLVCWEVDHGSEFFTPPRSTLSVIPEVVCGKAVDLLEMCMEPNSPKTIQDVLIPYCFIERESLAPVPCGNKSR